MQLITMSNHSPHIDSEEINPGNVCRLLSDPYVIFTTGNIKLIKKWTFEE